MLVPPLQCAFAIRITICNQIHCLSCPSTDKLVLSVSDANTTPPVTCPLALMAEAAAFRCTRQHTQIHKLAAVPKKSIGN